MPASRRISAVAKAWRMDRASSNFRSMTAVRYRWLNSVSVLFPRLPELYGLAQLGAGYSWRATLIVGMVLAV